MPKPKRPTIRFFSARDDYRGFKFLTEVTYFELLNWLQSGNYLKYNDKVISASSTKNEIFSILRKGK